LIENIYNDSLTKRSREVGIHTLYPPQAMTVSLQQKIVEKHTYLHDKQEMKGRRRKFFFEFFIIYNACPNISHQRQKMPYNCNQKDGGAKKTKNWGKTGTGEIFPLQFTILNQKKLRKEDT